MKIVNYFLSICALVFISACSDDTDVEKAPSIAGFYKISSMTADIAVDLDNNGVVSANLIAEIPYYFDSVQYDLQITPTAYTDQPNNRLITVYLPNTNLSLDYPGEPNGYSTFSRSGFSNGYLYNESSQIISILRGEQNDAYEAEFGRLESLGNYGDNQLIGLIKKNYYDYSSGSWKVLAISCIYYKVNNI